MQTLFTYAAAKPLAIAAAALFAALALRWAWLVVCAERRRRGLVHFLFGAALSLLVVCHVGGKTNSPPRSAAGGSPWQAGARSSGEPLRSLDPGSSNLWFAGIERLPNSVALGVAWNVGAFPAPPFIEFFAKTNLASGSWALVGWAEPSMGETNMAVEVEASRISGGAMPDAAFFAATAEDGLAADGADDDGDGITNAAERTFGTNPRRADTDGDGLSDGVEVARVSYEDQFPVLDMLSLTNFLSGVLPYQPVPASVAFDIPFSVNLSGLRSNRVLVHYEGIAAFLADGVSGIPAYGSFGAPITNVTNGVWAEYGLARRSIGSCIRNAMTGTDGLEVYFIPGLDADNHDNDSEPAGQWTAHGIIVKNSANASTVAHEIGHACGWCDIHCDRDGADVWVLRRGVRRTWLDGDWSGGTGHGFYDSMLLQSDLIKRLLMYGHGIGTKSDIPHGSIYGLPEEGPFGNIAVGSGVIMGTSPTSL